MALHINLYHEIHKQADQERRDPVKLASLGLLVVLLLLVFWYFYRASAVRKIESRRDSLRAEWARLEPQLKTATSKEPELLTLQKSNKALVDRVHERFYWAPLLAQLQTMVPSNVQIITLLGELDPVKEGAAATPTPTPTPAPAKDAKAAGRDLKEAKESKDEGGHIVTLLIKGIAAGPLPRSAAEEFRQGLQVGFSQFYSEASAVFDANSLEDGLEMVQIKGQSLPTANFRIRVTLKQPSVAAQASQSK